jgi:hypothetical protein
VIADGLAPDKVVLLDLEPDDVPMPPARDGVNLRFRFR